jgi:hypothetical protein
MAGLATRAVFGTWLEGAAGAATTIPTSGLNLWLNANRGVTSFGGNVSAWQKQSGNVNIATQTNSGNQPPVVASAVNSLPVIQPAKPVSSEALIVAIGEVTNADGDSAGIGFE